MPCSRSWKRVIRNWFLRPEGCAACSMQKHPQNAYRNGTMYSSYTAASYARIYDLAEKHKINLVGAVTWAFEFENQRWFDGFRDLATNGVDKPVLNVFRMFGQMPATRLQITNTGFTADDIIEQGVHGSQSDVNGLASKDDRSVAVMVWNYHDDDVAADETVVELMLKNIPAKKVSIHHYRVDATHSNSYEAWKKMGSPQELAAEHYKHLEAAGHLQLLNSPEWEEVDNGSIALKFPLPRQGVSLIKLTW